MYESSCSILVELAAGDFGAAVLALAGHDDLARPPEITYKDQLNKLNEALVMAEIDQHDERRDELDIEAVLDFAERVSLNASRLWLEASLDQRQRFQAFCFRKD